MEGVRRIIVFFNECLIGSIRAPKSFRDLKGLIEAKIRTPLAASSFKVSTSDVEFGRIFNQKTYDEWLSKAGFTGLSLQVESRKLANLLKKSLKAKKPKKIYKYTYEPINVQVPDIDPISYSQSFPTFLISPESCLCSIKASETLFLFNTDSQSSLELTIKKLQRSSRLLILNSSILVTGGCSHPSQSFEIKSSDFSTTELGSLNVPRFWHAMGLISGYAAVIGGCSSSPTKTHIKSVEILKENTWILYPDLNFARSSPSVAMYGPNTYVFGGLEYIGELSFPLNSIEQWNGGSWITMNCLLPLALQSVGVACINGNQVIIFGGKDFKNANIDKVFEIQFDNGIVRVLKNLEKPSKFPYGLPVVKSGKILMLDCEGEVFTINDLVND